jgi:hypothetical protein
VSSALSCRERRLGADEPLKSGVRPAGKLLLLDPFFSTSDRVVLISMTQHFLHAIIDAKVGGRFTCAPFQPLLPEAAAAAARELIRTRRRPPPAAGYSALRRQQELRDTCVFNALGRRSMARNARCSEFLHPPDHRAGGSAFAAGISQRARVHFPRNSIASFFADEQNNF